MRANHWMAIRITDSDCSSDWYLLSPSSSPELWLVLDVASMWIVATCGQPELMHSLMKLLLALNLMLRLSFLKGYLWKRRIYATWQEGWTVLHAGCSGHLLISWTAYKKLIAIFFLHSPWTWSCNFFTHTLYVFFSHPLPIYLSFQI